MITVLGILLVLAAGISDGTFYLPTKFMKKWEWEHMWGTFSLGFFGLSWIFTFILIPNIFDVYFSVARKELYILVAFGALWGIGSILIGRAAHLLGMALTYPITLGTLAACGSLVPLITMESENLFTYRGLLVIIGVSITVAGIIVCSRAYKIKGNVGDENGSDQRASIIVGLLVAVGAGVFSSFANIAFSYGENVIEMARELGTSNTFSGTAVWSIFFTVGAVVNVLYCLYLMVKRKTLKAYWGPYTKRNVILAGAMASCFICAIYVYSIGATCLGSWGEVPGWVLIMGTDIVTGNSWGLYTGEWDGAPKIARTLLKRGMMIVLISIVVVALSQVAV